MTLLYDFKSKTRLFFSTQLIKDIVGCNDVFFGRVAYFLNAIFLFSYKLSIVAG